MAEAEKTATVDRKRSPGYPTLDLEAAIAKVRTLYNEDKGAATSPEVIASHWATKTKSSAFMQDFASLKRYGLMVDAGAGGWKVSPHAVDILLMPEENPERTKRIKEAARSPRIFNELWLSHGTTLPSEANLVHKLVTLKGFQPKSAKDLIKQYKKTLAFAKLVESDKVADEQKPAPPVVGDFVQWESQGVAQFTEPRRVTSLSPDGEWAFVEGGVTGISTSELRRVSVPGGKVIPMTATINAPAAPPPAPPSPPAAKNPPIAPGQRDFPLYLTNNQRAILYVPSMMTVRDYELLKQQIDSHMAIIGATGVDPPIEPKKN